MSKRKGAVTFESALASHFDAPSPRTRTVVSLLILGHFGSLAIALSANLAPSFVHGEILPWLAPFHVSTAQDYVMLPLEVTHAADIDLPVAVEVRLVGETRWRRISLPQVESYSNRASSVVRSTGNRSRWPNLSRLVAWIAIEQKDSDVLPEFAMQLLRYAISHEAAIDEEAVESIRLVQPHVLTYDEYIMLQRGQGALLGDELSEHVLYAAKAVRTSSGEVRLVPEQEPAFTSKPWRGTSADLTPAVEPR